MKLHKVLWIDDKPSESLCFYAKSKGVELINSNCYAKGINELNRLIDQIEAVILDVNCLDTNDPSQAPSMQVFGNYLFQIHQVCKDNSIPWFVYTAGDFSGVDSLRIMIPSKERPWDDRQYYNKPKDRLVLLDNILKAIENGKEYKTKKRYSSVFDICPSDEYLKPLLRIMIKFDYDKHSDSNLFVDIRNYLEMIVEYLCQHGYDYQTDKETNESRLNEARKFYSNVSVASKNRHIPGYISWSLASCCEIVNKGCHENPRCPESNIVKLIDEGKGPYILHCAIFELLNFLHWAFMLPRDDESIAKLQDETNRLIPNHKNVKHRFWKYVNNAEMPNSDNQ